MASISDSQLVLQENFYDHVVCCHRITLWLLSMESFSVTSKFSFRGLSHCQGTYLQGNTEMLLCTYCVGLLPKTGNGNGFWHHCGDLGMIIILASSNVGCASESSPLFPRVCVTSTRNGNSGFLSGKCLLNPFSSSTLLLGFVPLPACDFAPLCFFYLCGCRMKVGIQNGRTLGEHLSTHRQV